MDTLNHTVVAQLRPRNSVRAMVIGIGAKPWTFSKARALKRCRAEFPAATDADVALIVEKLALEAEAAIVPVRELLGAMSPKRRPTAAELKRAIQKRHGIYALDPDGPLLGHR